MRHLNKEHNRREFIRNSALLGTFIALNPFSLPGFNPINPAGRPVPGERLTPVAVLMDTYRMISMDPEISNRTKVGLSNYYTLAACGGTLEKGKKYLPEILKSLKSGAPSDVSTLQKTAIVAGWLIYREISPAMSAVYPKGDEKEVAISCMYRDAAILFEFAPNQSPERVSTPEETADLLKQMWHRASSRMHTLTPDKENAQNWIVAVSDWYQRDQEMIHHLAEALHGTGTPEWEKYVEAPNFIGELDPVITLARRARKNRAIDFSIGQFQPGENQSLYAQALWNSLKAVKQLDVYLQGQQSESEMMAKLEIELD